MIDKKPFLIFELGHLEVFCYQTFEEFMNKITPLEVFWHKKGEPKIYGPFTNVYTAVSDYSVYIARDKLLPPTQDNLIRVDFKLKRRIP